MTLWPGKWCECAVKNIFFFNCLTNTVCSTALKLAFFKNYSHSCILRAMSICKYVRLWELVWTQVGTEHGGQVASWAATDTIRSLSGSGKFRLEITTWYLVAWQVVCCAECTDLYRIAANILCSASYICHHLQWPLVERQFSVRKSILHLLQWCEPLQCIISHRKLQPRPARTISPSPQSLYQLSIHHTDADLSSIINNAIWSVTPSQVDHLSTKKVGVTIFLLWIYSM